MGVFTVPVAPDGSILLPPSLAGAIGTQRLEAELLRHEHGTAIMVLSRPRLPEDRGCGGGHLRLPVPLLAAAGIADAAEIEGMGEYMIIRRPRAGA